MDHDELTPLFPYILHLDGNYRNAYANLAALRRDYDFEAMSQEERNRYEIYYLAKISGNKKLLEII